MNAIIEALDKIDDARRVLDLIEKATRDHSSDERDGAAINAACYTMRDHLEGAKALLQKNTGIAQAPVDVTGNICAAIGILQAQILARHSSLDARKMWGSAYEGEVVLEPAVTLLIEALDGL